MRKYYVEYSGYTAVEANSEDEAIEQAIIDGMLDLDFTAYTKSQWYNKKKPKGESK